VRIERRLTGVANERQTSANQYKHHHAGVELREA
jgi:hypothetical protein